MVEGDKRPFDVVECFGLTPDPTLLTPVQCFGNYFFFHTFTKVKHFLGLNSSSIPFRFNSCLFLLAAVHLYTQELKSRNP